MTARERSSTDRRRRRAVVALLGLATAAAAGLGNGMVSCAPPAAPADNGRPVSMAEAQRLAGVRLRDVQDGQSGFRATIGTGSAAVHVTGWVDWQRPLLYLDSMADKPGPADGLVQAVPELVAVRPGRLEPRTDSSGAVDPYPSPPLEPPADGWRVRRLTTTGPTASPFDGLLALLLNMAAAHPDDPGALAATGARYLRRDLVDGVPVDVFAGPAVPPSPTPPVVGPRRATQPSPSGLPFAADGGQVTYWLDAASRVYRLDALLRKDLPVRVDFRRADRTVPATVEVLGGAPVTPRAVTPAEAQVLARMALRDRAAQGGRVAVTLPVPPAGLVRADGWLDWRVPAAYLAVRDADDASRDALVWADRTGVSARPSASPGPPPVHPPAGGWKLTTWAQHDAQGSSDLDVLLNAALAAGPDLSSLRSRASWLRSDTLAGVPVTVYEIRGPAEAGTAPGQGLLRYWLDGTGMLRRLEVRTGEHAYGYLDITPGPVPSLTRPPVR